MYEKQGWLKTGSAVDLHGCLPFLFSTLRDPVPWPIHQDTFYDETAQRAAILLRSEIEQQVQNEITRSEQWASELQWYVANAAVDLQRATQMVQHWANKRVVMHNVSQVQQHLQLVLAQLAPKHSQRQALQQSAAQGAALRQRRRQEAEEEYEGDEDNEQASSS